MPVIDVSILRKQDPPIWTDLAGVDCMHADQEWMVAGIESGMQSGKHSIMLRLKLTDGTNVLTETSLAAWIAATCALRGAFPEAFADGPLRSHE